MPSAMPSAKNIFSRIKGNLGWLLANQCISQLIAFVGTIYLARTLGTAGFGQYALAHVVGQCLWIFGDCGISVYGVSLTAGEKKSIQQFFPLLTTIKAFASLLVFALYVLVLFFLPLDASLFWVMLGGGLFVLTNSLNGEWVFKGTERIEFVAISNFFVSIFFILSIILFVKGSQDVVPAIFLRSFSFLPGTVMLIYFAGKILHVERVFSLASLSGKIVKTALGYMLTSGMSMVYANILVILLGIFQPSAELGIFQSAYRPTLLIIIFGAIVPMAYFPIISDSYYNDTRNFKNIHSSFQIIMLALGLPIAVMGSLLSEDVIGLLYGTQYLSSFPIFQLLICIVPVTFLRLTYGQTLLACGFQKIHFVATTIATVVMGLVGIFLIRQYGAFGAALSFGLSEIIFFGILALCFSKYFFTDVPIIEIILKIVAANCFMAVIIYFFREYFLITAFGGLLVYVFFLWRSGVFSYAAGKIRQAPDGLVP